MANKKHFFSLLKLPALRCRESSRKGIGQVFCDSLTNPRSKLRGMRSLSLFTGILIFFCCFLPAERSLAGIRLAIAPFQVEQSQEKEVVRCRSCGNLFSGGSIEGDPANGLTRLLWEKFQNKGQEFELKSRAG